MILQSEIKRILVLRGELKGEGSGSGLWMWQSPPCVFFFKIFFFWCEPSLKSLLDLLPYCFCFMFQGFLLGRTFRDPVF